MIFKSWVPETQLEVVWVVIYPTFQPGNPQLTLQIHMSIRHFNTFHVCEIGDSLGRYNAEGNSFLGSV